MSTYNGEQFVKEQMDSILNQSYKNIEIVVRDDGSKDSTVQIVKEYQKKYKNIKVITQKNKGVNQARVTGFKNANGEYIAWVDSDDFVENNMYEKMLNLAYKNNSDVVICNYNFYPSSVKVKDKWFKEYKGIIDWKFILKNTIQCNKIVKKELLDKVDINNLFLTVGEGCYSIVLINAKKIATINECLYNYRVGHSSLSSNFKNIEWYQKTVNRALNKFEYVKNNNYSIDWQEFFYYVYLRYVLILMLISALNDKKNTYLETRQILKQQKFFGTKYYRYLLEDYSKLKIFVLKNICIKNYIFCRIVTKIVL